MLTVDGVSLRYGNFSALDDVTLTVDTGKVLAVLGPSGSGKSSLLRVIAGLEHPSRGTVMLAGRDITSIPVHQRNLGLMFQDYALFPHLDVSGNVSFGLRMAGRNSPDRVLEVLSLVGLDGFGDRTVESLSGGEQQRVALARALAPEPALLMLDEPVGALDRALRARLVPELSTLLRGIGASAIYVTHDQEEAFAIADRIAVINNGRLAQLATPEQLWRNPATEFVARFLGFENFSDATARAGTAFTQWGVFPSSLPDGEHRIVIRPEGVVADPAGDLVGEVVASSFARGERRLVVRSMNSDLVVDGGNTNPELGSSVRVGIDPDSVCVIPPSERRPGYK